MSKGNGRRNSRVLPISTNTKNQESFSSDNISEAINQLDVKELIVLNKKIVDRIKLLERKRQLDSMMRFQVGDKVSFDRDGRLEVGVIIRLNKKTVSMVTSEQIQWNVAPSLLNKVVDH